MASSGEVLWASELLKANSLAPFLLVGVRPDVELRLIFRAGSAVRNEPLSAFRVNRVRGWRLKSDRRFQAKVFIQYDYHTWDGGSTRLERQFWDVYVIRRFGYWHYFLRDRDVRIGHIRKPEKVIVAARQTSSAASSVKKAWSRPSAPLRPSPEVRAASDIVRAQEIHNSQIPWNDVPYTVLAPIVYEPFRRTWTGIRTPGFGSLKGALLPVNPYSSKTVLTQDGQGFTLNDGFPPYSSFEWFNHQWVNTSVMIASLMPPLLVHLDTAANKSLSKLLERAQIDLSANLAQDVAQYGQTVRLIRKNINRIVGSVRALKRGNFKSAISHLWSGQHHSKNSGRRLSLSRTLAENWLELQYGWKPLLKDIEGAMRSLAAYVARDPVVWVARGSGTDRSTEIKKIVIQGHDVGTMVIKTKTVVKTGLRYKIVDHQKAFLSQTGFTNPINLAWEVIPFSFVLDWFLPIGPYLEKLSAFDGMEFVDGFQTSYTIRTISAEIHSMIEGQSVSGRFRTYGTYSRTEYLMDRVKLTTFPSPRIPRFKNPVSVTHALNGLALLRVLFGRK